MYAHALPKRGYKKRNVTTNIVYKPLDNREF